MTAGMDGRVAVVGGTQCLPGPVLTEALSSSSRCSL